MARRKNALEPIRMAISLAHHSMTMIYGVRARFEKLEDEATTSL